MPQGILPSKLVSERITVLFDFLDELDWGDSITTATVEIQVEFGVDNVPQELLYKVPVVLSGRYVQQQVQAGIPGVLYQVKCLATNVAGVVFERWVRLAILPDNAQIPLFTATYLTSRPYPIEDSEGFTTAYELSAGRLLNEFVAFGPDSFSSSLLVITGTLVGGRETYNNEMESFNTLLEVLDGDLFGGVVPGNGPPESFNTALLPLQGTLVGGRVAYNHEMESFNTYFTPLAGTLV